MRFYSPSKGAIYPALKRMEKMGLVQGRVDNSKPLRPRKLYELTEAGVEELRSWLRSPIEPEVLQRGGHELELRLAFMDGLLSRREIVDFLSEWRATAQTYVRSLEDYFQMHAGELGDSPKAALRLGIEQESARLAAVRKILREFKRGDMA